VAPQATAWAPRLSTSAAPRASIGLGTTTKYLRRTRGNGLGTTTMYLRRTTIGAAGSGQGTTIKYLRRTASGAAGYGLSR
jgi:hypothetical protein